MSGINGNNNANRMNYDLSFLLHALELENLRKKWKDSAVFKYIGFRY